MTKLTTLTGDIDARDLAQIRAFAHRMLQGETPTQARLSDDRETGAYADLIVPARWKSCAHGSGWWETENSDGGRVLFGSDTPQLKRWTREDLIDALADVITDTHDMDVRDADYARAVVDWIDANLTPIPEEKDR